MGVCMCEFCDVWVCVFVGFVMCRCVCVYGGVCDVWVLYCVGVCVCVCWFCNVWVCVCMGFVMCG